MSAGVVIGVVAIIVVTWLVLFASCRMSALADQQIDRDLVAYWDEVAEGAWEEARENASPDGRPDWTGGRAQRYLQARQHAERVRRRLAP